MIIVKVEIHSAITGQVKNLGSLMIGNVGGTRSHGNYQARSYRAGAMPVCNQKAAWWLPKTKNATRTGHVDDHPRLSKPVWTLVRKALQSLGY